MKKMILALSAVLLLAGMSQTFAITDGSTSPVLTRNPKDHTADSRQATGFVSRYANEDAPVSMCTSSDSLEMLTNISGYFYGDDPFIKTRAAATPNSRIEIKTIPAQGIRRLKVNANLCGVVLQPARDKHFSLAYQGVDSEKSIAVSTEIKDGLLTVTAQGTISDSLYINASPDFRVNCVQLFVPAGVLKSLSVDCGVGIFSTDGLKLPPVSGGSERGILKLKTEAVSAPVTLSTKSGNIAVTADQVASALSLDSTNGFVEVKAKTATGKLTLTAKNGSVDASVDSIKQASFQAGNGNVSLSLGTITGDVSSSVQNGTMDVALTNRPRDLTLRLAGDWRFNRWNNWEDCEEEKYDVKEKPPLGLPEGWFDGMVLGSGKPTLTISASSNGDVSLTCPK